MTTYGDFPGVRVETAGGGITGVTIGAEEKLFLFGRGDIAEASASVNEPTQIDSRTQADNVFGSGTELANAMKDAISNGANISFLYGVLLDEQTDTESFGSSSSTQTGTLSNDPIVEDLGTITVSDVTNGTDSSDADFRVEFVYEGAPPNPTLEGSETDAVVINPLTGEWAADSTSEYEFEYSYLDWESAFDAKAVKNQVNEDETAIFASLSEAESVASSLNSTVTSMREDYQLVTGVAGAQPNQTGSDDGAEIDTANYSDNLDSDTLFVGGPVRKDTSTETALGAMGGLFAGNPIDDPIYNDELDVGDLEQALTKAEADELRAEQVIPIRQTASVRVRDNLSTSTEDDWERDFWRRRIVDRAVLIAKEVGDRIIGSINNQDARRAARRTIEAQLDSMANDNLIKSNAGGQENYFVEVVEDSDNPNQANINIGITPQGIVKRVDASVTINT